MQIITNVKVVGDTMFKKENCSLNRIKVQNVNPENFKADVIIYAITKNQLKVLRKGKPKGILEKEVVKNIKMVFFKAKLGEIDLIPSSAIKAKRVMFLGLGEDKKLDLEKVRKAYASAIAYIKDIEIPSFCITLPNVKLDQEKVIQSITEGLILGDYSFDVYKSEKRKCPIVNGTILGPTKYSKLVLETQQTCDNVNFVRDLVNETGNTAHPSNLVTIAKNISKKNRIKVTVLNQKQLKKKGLNLILAVGAGSTYPPYLVIMEYNGNKSSKEKIAVIGKGITFDSGGMNLKPSSYIENMKEDMAGAGTVIGIMKTLADLKIKKNIIGVFPAVENMIGPNAYKPGDIIKSYQGTSVEIGNTDAEGRLVLADAIAYIRKKYKPKLIVDLATLTGAVVVCLGTHVAGMFSNNDKYSKLMFEAGQETYERVWRLPMYDEYKQEIKSDIADINNIGPRYSAGSIMGAAFLETFVKKTPWIHLDIAGVAFLDKPKGYLPKGGTGTGLRLVLEFLKKA